MMSAQLLHALPTVYARPSSHANQLAEVQRLFLERAFWMDFVRLYSRSGDSQLQVSLRLDPDRRPSSFLSWKDAAMLLCGSPQPQKVFCGLQLLQQS